MSYTDTCLLLELARLNPAVSIEKISSGVERWVEDWPERRSIEPMEPERSDQKTWFESDVAISDKTEDELVGKECIGWRLGKENAWIVLDELKQPSKTPGAVLRSTQ